MRWAVLVSLVGCGSHPGNVIVDGPPGGFQDGAACDVAPSCPTGQWCTETAPIASTTLLASVWAVDNNDVYAVGDNGSILLRHCNAWSQMTSPTTQGLRAVWAASATDVWAVGAAGTVLHFDGTAWASVTGVTTADLAAIWGSSASDVWTVGDSGQAFHWNGSTWTASGLGGTLLSVTGTGPNDVWVTGESAYVRHYTGTWSAAINPAGSVSYFDLAAVAPNDVWVTGAVTNKEAMVYDGASWTAHGTSGAIIQKLFARTATDLWGVAGSKVASWNGTAWTIAPPTSVATLLTGISGTATDLFVVGVGAKILHRD